MLSREHDLSPPGSVEYEDAVNYQSGFLEYAKSLG